MKCKRIGCEKEATQRPFITFASEAMPDGGRAWLPLNPLVACDEHATTDPDDYITDEGWDQICAAMKQNGLAAPSRETVRVEYQPLLMN